MMLVLTRKVGESILIGGDIEVVILRVVNGRAKIGLRAPTETKIRRSELLQQDDNEPARTPPTV
jgi:carbon storage regulator